MDTLPDPEDYQAEDNRIDEESCSEDNDSFELELSNSEDDATPSEIPIISKKQSKKPDEFREREEIIRVAKENVDKRVTRSGHLYAPSNAEVHGISNIEGYFTPANYNEAVSCKHAAKWIKAMEEEKQSLMKKGTFIQMQVPGGKSPIPSHWIYSLKFNETGSIDRYKARLVANGAKQRNGIDYDQTFAPVARGETIRAFISAAVNKGHKIHQMDVTTAFLHGNIDKEIYMTLPKGFFPKDTLRTCRLLKSLYGLKQASRIWFQTLQQQLMDNGFIQSEADPCLFYKDDTYILLYVDDLIISGLDNSVAKLKVSLAEKFSMKDLGSLSFFLNIHFKPMKGGYLINQRQYIIELLINTGMTNCNTVSTPMTKSLSGEDSVLFENITLYETVLGKLNYISRYSRPDIGYAVSRLYQSVKAPTTADWQRVKRVLRYLKSTLDHGVLITASTDNL